MHEDFEVIKKYFSLSEAISQLIKKRKKADDNFYSQNMATKTEYTELGIFARAFRIEKMTIEHLMSLETINKRIERFELRNRYFNRFLKGLPQSDFNELKIAMIKNNYTGLSEKLIESVIDEIHEIETMICLREGIELPEKQSRITLSDDFNKNLNVLSNAFAI